MRRTSLLLNKARFHVHNADNAINKAYPLIKENKVMLIALNNLFMAYNSAALAILDHAKNKRFIDRIPEDFDSRLKLLEDGKLDLPKFNRSFIDLGLRLKSYVIAHKNSAIEFSRGGNYVICDRKFQYKLLSLQVLNDLYAKTKLFIDEAIRFTYIK